MLLLRHDLLSGAWWALTRWRFPWQRSPTVQAWTRRSCSLFLQWAATSSSREGLHLWNHYDVIVSAHISTHGKADWNWESRLARSLVLIEKGSVSKQTNKTCALSSALQYLCAESWKQSASRIRRVSACQSFRPRARPAWRTCVNKIKV